MVNALWITLIGMGLVFVAILLLWGLMALLVRVTAEREAPEIGVEEEASPVLESEAVSSGAAEQERKHRAAAAAVAVAMALRKPGYPERAAQPSVSVSAWQAVHRASQLSQRVSSNRKKVVR